MGGEGKVRKVGKEGEEGKEKGARVRAITIFTNFIVRFDKTVGQC